VREADNLIAICEPILKREKYRDDVSNRFAALEDLDAEVEINTIWETERI
jgi:hypothetical protein